MKCAFLIGITYPNTDIYLPGCENDILNIYKYLKSVGYEKFIICCDVPSKFISINVYDTTFLDIKKGFEEFIKVSKKYPNSTLFFHYSGHGLQVVDINQDEIDKKDECIITRDLNIITDDLLNQYFSTLCPCSKIFCLLDCCNSGTILDLQYNYEKKKFIKNNKKIIKAQILVLSGCRDEQQSVAVYNNNIWRGAHTDAFLKITKTVNGICKINELYNKCNEYVKNYSQISQISVTSKNIALKFSNKDFEIICNSPECPILKTQHVLEQKKKKKRKKKKKKRKKKKKKRKKKKKKRKKKLNQLYLI